MNMTQYDEQPLITFSDGYNSGRDNTFNAKNTRAFLKGKVKPQFIRNPGINTYVSGSKHTGTKSKSVSANRLKKGRGQDEL
ncbi:hypothetical protein [Arsenophonus nasoniae]|uniref:Uncharacterized protein n=1 Tax=Arsenophonus nasoniae TaxID=638 RepID=A0A4P7L1F4_9GAMM|nr:hypothetical protein [Arsenophonus nasoniae]QBY43708.1 hypothetical protein ArsFIN_22760 [Arsenophonus nasoniae]